jgi:hypothetical protein
MGDITSLDSDKELRALTEDLLGELERDNEGNYLVMVYSPAIGTYEWMPVNEEMVELLTLIEANLHGEHRNRKKGKK